MHFVNRIMSVTGIAVLLVNVAVAQEQTSPAVSFVDITDAVAGRFFDATTTAADPADPNTLIIRFNTGRDPATLKGTDFRASTAAFSHTSAMDTITFRVVPPSGYYVSRLTYSQQGSGTIYRTGLVLGASNWVVGDYAADLGVYATNAKLSRTIDLTGAYWPVLPVAITTGVHAFSTPLLGSATLSITAATVLAELSPLPQAAAEDTASAEQPPAEDVAAAEELAVPGNEPALTPPVVE
jgi:hypothetical protein